MRYVFVPVAFTATLLSACSQAQGSTDQRLPTFTFQGHAIGETATKDFDRNISKIGSVDFSGSFNIDDYGKVRGFVGTFDGHDNAALIAFLEKTYGNPSHSAENATANGSVSYEWEFRQGDLDLNTSIGDNGVSTLVFADADWATKHPVPIPGVGDTF